MYKKYFQLIALAMLIALSPSALTEGFSASSPETQGLSSERLERLSALSEKYVQEGRVSGIVNLVLRNGKVVHYEAAGQRGSDNDAAMEVDDLFRIYSMTICIRKANEVIGSDPERKFVVAGNYVLMNA